VKVVVFFTDTAQTSALKQKGEFFDVLQNGNGNEGGRNDKAIRFVRKRLEQIPIPMRGTAQHSTTWTVDGVGKGGDPEATTTIGTSIKYSKEKKKPKASSLTKIDGKKKRGGGGA